MGTGKPKREFLYSDDLAQAIITVLEIKKKNLIDLYGRKMPILNIGSGEEISIKRLSNYTAMTLPRSLFP